MYLRFVLVSCLISVSLAKKEYHDWELAVVIDDQIELLESNGTVIGSTQKQFNRLKALAFDKVRRQFVVSDMDHRWGNDTIYLVNLTKEDENVTDVVADLPGDVQGLAVDPIEDVLYWTDSVEKTINFVRLNDAEFTPQVLISFTEYAPLDIVIDVCRRYIYWTNHNDTLDRALIARARLNGSDVETLMRFEGDMPRGLAIDYKLQRLYWTNKKEGQEYSIESSDLHGKEKEVVVEETGGFPFDVAVDETAVYWTDLTQKAVYRYLKSKSNSVEIIREYNVPPMGLISKNMQVRSYPECQELDLAIEREGPKKEYYKEVPVESIAKIDECLNGGTLVGSSCVCPIGYVGKSCEIELCHNYCIHGRCRLSHRGYPQCVCPKGFGGERCEMNMCTDYCMNGGKCSYIKDEVVPNCDCPKGFAGSRCEVTTDFISLCSLFCTNNDGEDHLLSKDEDLICRCENNSYNILKNNGTSTPAMAASYKSPSEKLSFFQKLTSDTDFAMMLMGLGFAIVIIIGLSGYIYAHRRLLRYKRPTIRKRIIVNKNVTPLTYRPQPNTEQCEITIENCCNMNICETPCFEPVGRKKEDKKKLLADMEHQHLEDY